MVKKEKNTNVCISLQKNLFFVKDFEVSKFEHFKENTKKLGIIIEEDQVFNEDKISFFILAEYEPKKLIKKMEEMGADFSLQKKKFLITCFPKDIFLSTSFSKALNKINARVREEEKTILGELVFFHVTVRPEYEDTLKLIIDDLLNKQH